LVSTDSQVETSISHFYHSYPAPIKTVTNHWNQSYPNKVIGLKFRVGAKVENLLIKVVIPNIKTNLQVCL